MLVLRQTGLGGLCHHELLMLLQQRLGTTGWWRLLVAIENAFRLGSGHVGIGVTRKRGTGSDGWTPQFALARSNSVNFVSPHQNIDWEKMECIKNWHYNYSHASTLKVPKTRLDFLVARTCAAIAAVRGSLVLGTRLPLGVISTPVSILCERVCASHWLCAWPSEFMSVWIRMTGRLDYT